MVSIKVWKCVLVLGAFVTLVNSKASIQKRNAGGVETVLEAQIKSFSPDAFSADVQLIQKVDRINKISQYKLPSDEEFVYERNQDDSASDIIIFTAEQDKIPFKKTKRAYVALKQGQAPLYFAKLALVRDATDKDKNPVSIDGANRGILEWTIYDDHVIAGRSPLTLAALTCMSSILVPCLFNESALVPAEKFVTSPKYNPKQSPKNVVDEVEATKFITADGSDSNDNYDYYIDLEVNKVQGRILVGLLGGIGGVVPGLLGTVISLLCTVLSLLSICPGGGALGSLLGKKRRKRGAADVMDKVMDYPGWTTQYAVVYKDITFAHETEIFYGMGNCPYVPVKREDFLKAQNPDEIINHYVTILRAECISTTALVIQGLLKDGLISVSLPDRAFHLNQENKVLTNIGLSVKELLNINTATEIAAFSAVYGKQAESPSSAETTAPDGQRQVTRSIHFMVQVGLTYLKLTREHVRAHILHLTRNLLLNVFNVFNKLAQDNQNLQPCADCTKDKEVNLNDRLLVISLSQFIKRGLGPVERGADVFATFDTFYKQNEATLIKMVNIYS